jgi:hypothetical protein
MYEISVHNLSNNSQRFIPVPDKEVARSSSSLFVYRMQTTCMRMKIKRR